ncbi:DNA polymerase-3 subunit delta' [Thiothrix eikelboomii]|uniref:DNA-directed DNA polymerase n=1 Tax=Thiothrix eikelboomii TaxID=92487 RepID=A0A1T4W3B4_9GAMM|nr:DNA polymerase III subunit delta' [Thiothrix eikelboomii]SKA71211.1 DNA polymerase-3 subunit delta' [Thiothrix eikelboomii]
MTDLLAVTYAWHQTIWQQLKVARQQQHLPHALLFSGQLGCGHEHLVYALAQSLLCLQPDAAAYACGQCRSCKVFAAQAHPDFMLLDLAEDKQVITVEQVRSLHHFLELSRSYSPHRVVMIIHADAMNTNAANSLLKSLEEPADNSYILLFTAHPTQLMPTIRSRCQQLRLASPNQAQALTWLQAQALGQTTAHKLLAITGGRPLAALVEESGERLQQQTLFFNHLIAVLAGNLSLTEVATQWEKYDRQELLNWQLTWVQQWIRQSLAGVGDTTTLELTELTRYLKPDTAWQLYERLLELKALATHPLNGRLLVENMLALWF